MRSFKKRLNRLEAVFKSLATTPLRGTFFRSIDARYLLASPLSALGSLLFGGRYNHVGWFEALYLADTPHTALFEVEHIYKDSDGKVAGRRMAPRALLSIDADLQHVIDLRQPEVQAALEIAESDLLAPWKLAQARGEYPLTHLLGAAARAAGIEGIIAPSARSSEGFALVVFPDRLRSGSVVTLYNGDDRSRPPTMRIAGIDTPEE